MGSTTKMVLVQDSASEVGDTQSSRARKKINWGCPQAQIETAAAAGNMKKVSTEASWGEPPLGRNFWSPVSALCHATRSLVPVQVETRGERVVRGTKSVEDKRIRSRGRGWAGSRDPRWVID